ncbi:MAG: YidC/Oxa1 family membrane protein insertase [Oscillospiraceae bacterium]|nr:YidC/Oxa1 family membrane protein insertase [Oscillospiraceae bacterium]
MDFWQIIMTPFSWLLKILCQVFNNYGVALILFTLIVKIILFPLSLKGKKSMIKMNLASADLKEIQKRCGNDRERYNQEVQKYYSDNNISPMGGCGWSMIPLLILMPLYAIIRRPMKYMMRLNDAGVTKVAEHLGFDIATSKGYGELTLASMMNAGNLESAKTAAATAGVAVGSMFVINFNFLGLDLSQIPTLKFWQGGLSWNSIGLFLLPIISAALSLVSMIVSQKTNQMGDESVANSNKSMMLISPLISLWIGFTLPAGLCIYWIANSALMMVQEVICGRMLKKDYEKARIAMAEQAKRAKEEEKERRRQAAERKAAAIAANKGKAKKTQPKEKGVDASASREGLRAYARGHAYDPNRYAVTPYHDPNPSANKPAPEEEPLTEEEKALLAEAGVDIPETPVEAETPVEETAQTEEGFEEAFAPESEDEEPKE